MRNIFHNNDAKQLNVLDERFYPSSKIPNLFHPSVTTILEVYPKGYGYDEWLKSVGFNAEIIMTKAGDQGSVIHNMIDKYLNGEVIKWINDEGKGLYTLTEWQMFSRFVEFWEMCKPEIFVHEFALVSDTLRFGGTIDFIGKINGEMYLVDWKSSNYIHKTHELQISAYATMWNEFNPKHKIDKTAILWLNASTRGVDKQGKKIQGKGWQLKDDWGRTYQDAYRVFEHTHAIWDEDHPNYKPANLLYASEYQKGVTTVYPVAEDVVEAPVKKKGRKSKSIKDIVA